MRPNGLAPSSAPSLRQIIHPYLRYSKVKRSNQVSALFISNPGPIPLSSLRTVNSSRKSSLSLHQAQSNPYSIRNTLDFPSRPYKCPQIHQVKEIPSQRYLSVGKYHHNSQRAQFPPTHSSTPFPTKKFMFKECQHRQQAMHIHSSRLTSPPSRPMLSSEVLSSLQRLHLGRRFGFVCFSLTVSEFLPPLSKFLPSLTSVPLPVPTITALQSHLIFIWIL
jgi:hypothetical protein